MHSFIAQMQFYEEKKFKYFSKWNYRGTKVPEGRSEVCAALVFFNNKMYKIGGKVQIFIGLCIQSL